MTPSERFAELFQQRDRVVASGTPRALQKVNVPDSSVTTLRLKQHYYAITDG